MGSRGRDVFARRGIKLGNVHPVVDHWFCTRCSRRSLSRMLPVLYNLAPASSVNASSGIHSDIDSAQSCQLLCVQTEDCVAFSWHFGSDQFDENTCQLFSEVGEET